MCGNVDSRGGKEKIDIEDAEYLIFRGWCQSFEDAERVQLLQMPIRGKRCIRPLFNSNILIAPCRIRSVIIDLH
jgi:hypothetical protein